MGYNVAIDGPAGAGKSTILALIQRHFDITQGDVRFHDIPLQSWLQKKKDTFMLILVPCTAGLQYIF